MIFQQNIEAFTKLGQYIKNEIDQGERSLDNGHLSTAHGGEQLHPKIEEAYRENPWFTPEFQTYALQHWSDLLSQNKTEQWLSAYDAPASTPKKVLLVMAGNIPLVGFHD